MGRPKKITEDDFEDDMDLEAEAVTEAVGDFTDEEEEQVEVAQEALKNIHALLNRTQKAITVNQSYIKKLWTGLLDLEKRIEHMESNFELLLQENKK